MKKILFFVALLLPLMAWAQERSVNDAAVIAAEFMNNQQALSPVRKAACSASSLSLAHTRAKLNSTEPAFYVFNRGNDAGYVIVSADDRTEDVLVYSEEGELDMDNINPNFAFWLNRLQEEISVANDENTYTTVEKKARKATNATAISPLLVNDRGESIAWYQESPYWNKCPMDLWKTSERCLTGCVATAAAQIMYKWRHPAKGTGSHSYTWECCTNSSCTKTSSQKLSVDFSTVTFDWDNMLSNYNSGKSGSTAQKDAVATLMYCCGVACDMGYGGSTIGGSGAWTDDMGYGLVTYFGYKLDKFVSTYTKNNYENYAKYAKVATLPAYHWSASTNEFTSYFNADLEAGRPILMGGEDRDGGGHEFVCDGRNSNGYFHINWGWEGDSNNYCLLSALKPSGTSYNFSNNIDALIGLEPAVTDTVRVTGVSVSPTSKTLKINEKETLTATVTPSNATVKGVSWSCDNLQVASVTTAGEVTGVGAGTAHITATTKDGGLTASATITVTNEVAPKETFKWVTDANQLKAGDEIILMATYSQVHYVMDNNLTVGAFKSSINYCGVEIVQIADSTITLDKNSQAAVYTLGGSAGSWTLTEASNGKLGATGSKKIVWDDGTQTWTISIDAAGKATVQNGTSSYGRILYNNNNDNPRYSIYGSNTATSSTLLLPEIFARSTAQKDTVVKVTGVTLGQNSAIIKMGETIKLHHSIQPATATNRNVTWSTNKTSIATVDADGNVKGVEKGAATITITTADGNYQASCAVTVVDSLASPADTVYVLASEAQQIGVSLGKGNTSTQFYGVKGYVTMANSQTYNGFYIDDAFTDSHTFQGYNCQMPSGVIVLTEGQYVCIYGFIMNYNDTKMQIKDGEVVLLDTPQGLDMPNAQNTRQNVIKMMQGGQLYILRSDHMYNLQGEAVK